MEQKVKIGRIVTYNTKPADQEYQVLEGGIRREQLPAIVVSVQEATETEPETANLRVFGDSAADIWVRNATQGTLPGQWQWNVIASQSPDVDKQKAEGGGGAGLLEKAAAETPLPNASAGGGAGGEQTNSIGEAGPVTAVQ